MSCAVSRLAACSVLLLLIAAPSPSQQPADKLAGPSQATQSWPAREDAKITAAELIHEFEAGDEVAYELGEGDQITIEVWGRPELSGQHTIGPDGEITLQLCGPMRIVGLTREKAAEAVSRALGRYYTDLTVNIRVEQYNSNRVFVLGRVAAAGALRFETPPTLLEAITRAGSLPASGAGPEKAVLTRCAVFRGRDRVIWIDLRSLLTQGNLALNLRLKRNDIVYIPDAKEQLVYVLGEVQHPGAFALTTGMSLIEAFSQSGGLTADGAATRIQLIHQTIGVSRQFALADLLKPNGAFNESLEEGDIVYVPSKHLAQIGYLMQKVSPLTGFALLGATVAK